MVKDKEIPVMPTQMTPEQESAWKAGYEAAMKQPVMKGWSFRKSGDGIVVVSRELGPDELSTGVFREDHESVPWEFIFSLVESLSKREAGK